MFSEEVEDRLSQRGLHLVGVRGPFAEKTNYPGHPRTRYNVTIRTDGLWVEVDVLQYPTGGVQVFPRGYVDLGGPGLRQMPREHADSVSRNVKGCLTMAEISEREEQALVA